ncbi:MAG: helicase-exonuclease AddAB subunit AddA [Lachnospiraceae bacterium]
MGVTWTKEQQQVIALRNRNILVSAAAGSGKTAVLVERIITMLTQDVPPTDIDRLLVVTYTEAAAAEMKERIRDGIEKKLEEFPDDIHLQKQATLIYNARITTIHSFCLSVIREHFHTIDLDPAFRIAEEGELKLLKHDVVQEVLELHYEEGSLAFLEFIECFATGKDDRQIEELILRLFEFSRSYPDPLQWLSQCADVYEVTDLSTLEQMEAVVLAKSRVHQYAKDMGVLLEEGLEICQEAEGPYMYASALQSDWATVQKLEQENTLATMYQVVSNAKWERLASNRDQGVSEKKTELVKAIRQEVKKVMGELKEAYFYQAPEELLKDIQSCKESVGVLTGLVQEFADRLAAKKREKNVIDFGDMEQFALRILTREEAGIKVPSSVAKEYQEMFQEVMIDEYQDSNLIQEAILTSVSKESQGIHNIFMVGDVKQSIYRFRLSRPELFMEKFNTYSQEDSAQQRIDLHKNFRSREGVLKGVNFLFRQLMTKSLGGITYDANAALYAGADYEDHPDMETEVLLVNMETQGDEFPEMTQREQEAMAIAGRIEELVGKQMVREKETGTYRPARYGDIVILLRNLKGWSDVFATVLNREGIPAFTGTKEGYFQTQEIKMVLDYLRVLDNQKQDFPLTAIMTSPIGKFTSQELAQIRTAFPKIPFFEAVPKYVKEGEHRTLAQRLQKFLAQMEQFRKRVPYTAIHQLLYQILSETGYGDYARGMPGGAQRKANLDMLLEKAKAFETTSYKGLFNFVRYMEQLQVYNIDYGEANIVEEQANTVRIMSIHKSKGLEFPIVFAAGMSQKFNTQDGKGSMLIHPELGMGMDAIDLKRRTKAPTFLKKVMKQEVLNENRGEELRVLYVALTRAKEKLIMVGTMKNVSQKLIEYESVRLQKEIPLTFSRLTKANCYYDWIIPALIRHGSFGELLAKYEIEVPFTNPLYQEEVPISCREIQRWDIADTQVFKEMQSVISRVQLEQWDTTKIYDEKMKQSMQEQFSYEYPYPMARDMKLKFTVSELKKREYMEETGEMVYEEPEVVPLLPKFLQGEEKLQGAGRGTAYHKFLELHDFTRKETKASLELEIRDFLENGKLSQSMKDAISTDDILEFFHSQLVIRMQKAAVKKQCYKEQPFVLGVDAKELYAGETGEEIILIQGIVDAYFEEDGQLVVADYKTDQVKNGFQLSEKYHKQLEYYARALEQLTGKPVKEKIIYSFTLKEEVSL